MFRSRQVAIAVTLVLDVAGAAEDLFKDIDLTKLTRPPFWEPSLEDYFPMQSEGMPRNEAGLAAPFQLTSPSTEEFQSKVRKGYPIVVTDWGKDMEYVGWSGRDFAETFPFGYVKAEYINYLESFKEKDHDVKHIDGELRVNLGNFKPDKKTMWHNYSRPAAKAYADDPEKPTSGPYVWHVKDELTGEEKVKVQRRFQSPPFLSDTFNRAFMNRTFEIWFSPGGGSGAGAHNDGYCESVVSLQLKGEKKWRYMHERPMTFLHSYDEFDGGVYKAGFWNPDLAHLLRPGQATIWPPGYLHETKTLQPEDGLCGAAITVQFAFPQPVQYLRTFLPRLTLSAEVGQCTYSAWSGYVHFFITKINKPSAITADIEKQRDAIVAAVDTNNDGQITYEEVLTHLTTMKKVGIIADRMRMYRLEASKKQLFYEFLAKDTVAYHDTNDDMIVSSQELWDSLVQYNVVMTHTHEGLKYANFADKQGLEDLERSVEPLRREPIEFPEEVRPELKKLFKKKRKKGVLKNIEKIHSFSDVEFFSPLAELAQRREL